MVVADGETAEFVGQVKSGWLARFRSFENGQQQFTGMYFAGDYVCLDALFEAVNYDTIIAAMPSTMVSRSVREMKKILQTNNDVQFETGRELVLQNDRLREGLGLLACQKTEQRLIGILYRMRQRMIAASVMAPDARAFNFPIKQTQLARIIGVSKIHVNRILVAAKKERFYEIRKGVFMIHEWQRFEGIAISALGGSGG